MIVRALDTSNDWTFGSGKNNYKVNLKAVAQNIQTRLSSFLGDCFFATNEGIDWFNLLGGKDQVGLRIAIGSTIINTPNVTGILLDLFSISDARVVTIQYRVQTTFGTTITGDFVYDAGAI